MLNRRLLTMISSAGELRKAPGVPGLARIKLFPVMVPVIVPIMVQRFLGRTAKHRSQLCDG
jgi:hypothetical protein